MKIKKKRKPDTIYDHSLSQIQGMFPNGGLNTPIKGTKEQYQAYQDSLDLYNSSKNWSNFLLNPTTTLEDFDSRFNADTTSQQFDNIYNRLEKYNKVAPTSVKTNKRTFNDGLFDFNKDSPRSVQEYKKPVQPIIYQPEEKKPIDFKDIKTVKGNLINGRPHKFVTGVGYIPLDEQPINIQSYTLQDSKLEGNNQQLEFNPIGFKKGSYFTRDAQQQEVGGKEYFDKVTGHKLMQNGGYQEFQRWKSKLPTNLQNEKDYDLQGAWHNNLKPSSNLHLPDTYKLPNHETFSNESIYFNPQNQKYAGHWEEQPKSWNYIPYNTQYKDTIVEPKEFGNGGFIERTSKSGRKFQYKNYKK